MQDDGKEKSSTPIPHFPFLIFLHFERDPRTPPGMTLKVYRTFPMPPEAARREAPITINAAQRTG